MQGDLFTTETTRYVDPSGAVVAEVTVRAPYGAAAPVLAGDAARRYVVRELRRLRVECPERGTHNTLRGFAVELCTCGAHA